MAGLTSAISHLQLDELTGEIKRTMRRSAKDAVQLGYMLRRVAEEKLWVDTYADFDSYLQTELQMDYTLANRFIGINKRFSFMGNSMEIADKYEQYSQGLLIEMLSMTPEQEAKVTPDMTVRQAREIKKRGMKPKQPSVLPVPEEEEIIVEGDFREIKEPEKVATSQPEKLTPAEPDEIAKLRGLLEEKKRELGECLKVDAVDPLPDGYVYERKIMVGALANMLCELENMQDAEPEPEPEQPELPILKNNDQRKEWLSKYKNWGLWYRDERIDVNYYKYDFQDGSRLVVEEYPQRRCNWRDEKWDGVYYHLMEKNCKGYKSTYDKQYVHSADSETYLVEFLKNLQRG